MWKLAFRNVFRHKVRSALTLGAIASGVVGLIISGGFVEDIFFQLREFTIRSQLGHIQVYKLGYYVHGRQAPFRYVIDRPAERLAELAALPDVRDVLPRLNFAGLLGSGRATLPVIGEGVDPDKEAALGSRVRIIAGRQLTGADRFGILIGEGVAAASRLAPGDPATVLASTGEGALNGLEFQVIGVFQTMSKDYDDRAVRIPFAAAQELLVTPSAHALVLSLDDTGATDRVAAELKKRLPPGEFEVKAWYELADFYVNTVALYRRLFGVLQIIILGVVLLSVINSVSMTVYERTGEHGTLMALGNRRKQIFRLVMAENAILGLVGSCLGTLLGVALAEAISAVGIPMPPPPNASSGYTAYIRPVAAVVVTAWGVGFAATALAALLPARRASRLPIAEALRQA